MENGFWYKLIVLRQRAGISIFNTYNYLHNYLNQIKNYINNPMLKLCNFKNLVIKIKLTLM